jgi:phosphoglycerate dehydrogenase-like enzyme
VNTQNLTILIEASCEEDLPERIAAIAPGARIVTPADLESEPALIEQLDIVYGRLRKEQFPRAKRLRWVQSISAGMDFAQDDEARSHPAIFTAAHIHATVMSEHLFGLLLMLRRQLHAAHNFQLACRWDRPGWADVDTLEGKTLCIVGAGVIGRRCAALGEAFGMEVIAVRRRVTPTPHVKKVYSSEQLFEALGRCDVVMVILPNTPRTLKIIDSDAFAAMRDGAIFLNVGRGRTVDTDALVEALRAGKLAAAALDVTDPEPLPPDHPLWKMPNVLITAHYAGMFPRYDADAEAIFLDNLRRFIAGEELLGAMNREEGY